MVRINIQINLTKILHTVLLVLTEQMLDFNFKMDIRFCCFLLYSHSSGPDRGRLSTLFFLYLGGSADGHAAWLRYAEETPGKNQDAPFCDYKRVFFLQTQEMLKPACELITYPFWFFFLAVYNRPKEECATNRHHRHRNPLPV